MDLQEALALGLVALVVGIVLWRRLRRRSSGNDACSNCDAGRAKPPREAPLRFHRRR